MKRLHIAWLLAGGVVLGLFLMLVETVFGKVATVSVVSYADDRLGFWRIIGFQALGLFAYSVILRAVVVWFEKADEKVARKVRNPEKPVAILADGLCNCTCADPCPLGKTGSAHRCTPEELHSYGIATINNTPKPGDDATIV